MRRWYARVSVGSITYTTVAIDRDEALRWIGSIVEATCGDIQDQPYRISLGSVGRGMRTCGPILEPVDTSSIATHGSCPPEPWIPYVSRFSRPPHERRHL